MQDYITMDDLESAGIVIDGQDIDAVLDSLNEQVEERIGAEITESLDEDKLEELLQLQENGTDQQLGEWLTANVPDLQDVIEDNVDIVLGELAAENDKEVAATKLDDDEDDDL
ncbi:hypothetical protein JNJ66_05540 [Candidatus Saccharibacteria bacterium]|nr:hypothetical protein [Candidatus Saccharibacteria bacterium]